MSFKNFKTLVVDDMATIGMIIRSMLEEIGFRDIEYAENGRLAWEKIEKAHGEKTPYRFIVSDWNMPEMNGLALLKKIKNIDSSKKIHFLMVAAESEYNKTHTLLKEGASDVIVKPFSCQAFNDKIYELFKPFNSI
ncbi:MAG: response regulator [Halobacteriovoraceae bacterium]|nr:response regulator [Halobacteriovoraceae bacterium]